MNAPLIDIGVNLTHDRFGGDRDAVIDRAREAGVAQMVVTGASLHDTRGAIELARARPGVLYATAGAHPHVAERHDAAALATLADLARAPEVRAVGETGLDFNRDFSPRADQERVFAAQLETAAELGKPLFLHQRDAHQRFVAILRDYLPAVPAAVVHCFTDGAAELDDYLDLGLYIGITGWICDERRGAHLRDIVGRVPSDRLMIETDAPYLLPRDLRPRPKSRRNEPAHLPHIAEAIARARGESPEELAAATTATAGRFFGLADD